MTEKHTRRQFIAGGSIATITAIAGCSSYMGGSGDQSGGSGAITNTTVQGSLQVSLNPDRNVDSVSLAGPDGETWRQKTVRNSGSVSVNLLSNGGYPPGEQTIQALDSEENVIGSATIDISPSVKITEIGFAKDYDIPTGALRRPLLPVVHFENTGSGPDKIQKLEIDSTHTGRIYEPGTVLPKKAEVGASAGRDGAGVAIQSGETQGVRVDRPAIGKIGANRDCEQTINVTLTAGMTASPDKTVEFKVTGSAPEGSPPGLGGWVLRDEKCALDTEMK